MKQLALDCMVPVEVRYSADKYEVLDHHSTIENHIYITSGVELLLDKANPTCLESIARPVYLLFNFLNSSYAIN